MKIIKQASEITAGFKIKFKLKKNYNQSMIIITKSVKYKVED